MITVVLADDHPVVRRGLRALLEAEPDFQVVGEAGDGLEAIGVVNSLQPDILVLDLMMGGLNGLQVTRQVRKGSPRTGVVILSMYGTESYVLEALRSGAKGYVVKEATSEELVRAVRAVAMGRRYLGSSLSERAIEVYMEKTKSCEQDPYDTLSHREREVLHLAAEGCSNSEIASRLYLSRRTVEIHRANMMHKLGLRTQTDLLRYALRRGILPPET